MTFGMLGRLSWEKNHDLFFRAARRFLDGGGAARFLVAGEGAERPRLERQRDELELAKAIEFAGFVLTADFFARTAAGAEC